MIFIYNFFYLTLLSLLENKIKLNKKIILILSIFPLVLMIVFLKNFPDDNYYYDSYIHINEIKYNGHFNLEKGYLFLSKIFFDLGFSYHWFKVTVLIIILCIFLKKIYDKNEICFKVLLFYSTTFIFTVLVQYRSGLVLALFLVSGIELLKKNKNIFYTFYILFLTQIHSGIILFLPLIVLRKITSKKMKIFILLCTILIPFFYQEILELINILSIYIPGLEKVNNYLNNPVWYDVNGKYGRRDIFTIILYLLLVLKLKIYSKRENIYLWIFYLSIFYRSIFIKVPEVGFRAYLLCQFSLIFLIPKLLKNKLFIKIISILVIFVYFYLLISVYGGGIILRNY